MKWARLMCGREFRVEAVMLLWDHIFASSWLDGRPGLPECLESVAVAMVRAYGVVRCGAVRCGAVRYGAVRCGAVRCGAVWCGAVRHPRKNGRCQIV